MLVEPRVKSVFNIKRIRMVGVPVEDKLVVCQVGVLGFRAYRSVVFWRRADGEVNV